MRALCAKREVLLLARVLRLLKMSSQAIIRLIATVRGARLRDSWNSLRPGLPCSLRRQPSNEYDANAIIVLSEDTEIGYINREVAALLSPAIEQFRLDVSGGKLDIENN